MRVLVRLFTCLWLPYASSVAAEGVVFNDPVASQINMSQFSLTEVEAARVERLRRVDVSFGVSNLSALELLGKYAETDLERMEYARKHVLAMVDNVGRSQAWSLAVYEASQEENMVDALLRSNPGVEEGLAKLNMAAPDDDWSGFRRGVADPLPTRTLFVSLDCREKCFSAYLHEQAKVFSREVTSLDVVFVGSKTSDENAIFKWAKEVKIDGSALENRLINLHVDNADWRKVRKGISKVPRLVR